MTRNSPIPETLTLHVPFQVVKRGGRKEMHLPEGVAPPRRADSTLVKALARAFRWKRMLEEGEFSTIAELAVHEGTALSYVTRILRLTLLSPELVDAILDGSQAMPMAEELLRMSVDHDWSVQKRMLERDAECPVVERRGRADGGVPVV